MARPEPQSAALKLLMTKKETAEFFAVSERTVDRWLLEGVLPADAKCLIGGVVRFRKPVLLKLVAVETSDDLPKPGDLK